MINRARHGKHLWVPVLSGCNWINLATPSMCEHRMETNSPSWNPFSSFDCLKETNRSISLSSGFHYQEFWLWTWLVLHSTWKFGLATFLVWSGLPSYSTTDVAQQSSTHFAIKSWWAQILPSFLLFFIYKFALLGGKWTKPTFQILVLWITNVKRSSLF